MKIKAYTTITEPVGNVAPGTVEIINAQAVTERPECYDVMIHSNETRVYTKKYWNVEITE